MNNQFSKNAYPSYVNSSIRWVGSYPDSWNLTRVKFESYVKARVGWHGLKSDDFTESGPYLVTGTDFSGSRINWQDCHHCDEWRYEQDPYIQLCEGDLLVTKDGTIGKLALVEGLDGKATLNSGVFVVRPLTTRYTSRFYFWLLSSSVFHGFVEYRRTGSTIVHLYQETFENFSFAMPLVREQVQIAKFLDYETAKIDALIEKQQQLIALLKEKRQAVMSHAVTKGLSPDAPMRDSGVEWLGEIPAHWEIEKLYHLTSRIGDGLHGTPSYEDGTSLFFVNGNNLEDGRIVIGGSAKEVPMSEYERHYIPMNSSTVLLSINGTIGKVAIYANERVILGKSAAYINCLGRLKPNFLQNFFQSLNAQRYYELVSTGTTISNLSLDSIRQLRIGIPSLDEQAVIVEFCMMQREKYDKLIAVAFSIAEKLRERRTALISAAVTGKIDVRGWKPPESKPETEAV